jgi:hypothetical protein
MKSNSNVKQIIIQKIGIDLIEVSGAWRNKTEQEIYFKNEAEKLANEVNTRYFY